MADPEDNFYARADAHINLANSQLTEGTSNGKVSASLMFATARFNAWMSATGWKSSEEMKAKRQETIDYFVNEYTKMLEDNLDDYIEHFDEYLGIEQENDN